MRILKGARHLRAVPMLSLVAALAGSAVAACGSNSAGAAGTSLCGNVPQVDRLVIKRVNHLPQNHNRFTFPATVTVSDRRQAQAVARAACALPPMPKANMSCPFDWGVIFRLSFAVDGPKLPAVRVNASGCREVYGLSPARWTLRSPAFWRLLAKVMGIGPPSESTFVGI
jgi:hypothetical protein